MSELYDIGPRNFKPKDLLFGSVVEVATSYEAAALEVRSACWRSTTPQAHTDVTGCIFYQMKSVAIQLYSSSTSCHMC